MNKIIKSTLSSQSLWVAPLQTGLSPELQAALHAWSNPEDGTWKPFEAASAVIQEARRNSRNSI